MVYIKKNRVNETITPEYLFNQRRQFVSKIAGLAGAALLPGTVLSQTENLDNDLKYEKSSLSMEETLTPENIVTKVNNFYELGVGKNEPFRNAKMMKTKPWQIVVEGEVHKPRTFDIDELLKLSSLEERIYRLRCVEAWSMVVPWIGYSLRELIHQVQPTGNAKYVEFVSLADPEQMPGLTNDVLDWPYTEALRMDEAMHDLTLLCFGVYGKVLPNQNGAPVRLIAPWKYGFKSGKSIVKIRFVEHMPKTSWVRANPREYGFYGNVNPRVSHPRWSQATETRIGESGQRATRMFNGYEEQVASMYSGMDLAKYF